MGTRNYECIMVLSNGDNFKFNFTASNNTAARNLMLEVGEKLRGKRYRMIEHVQQEIE